VIADVDFAFLDATFYSGEELPSRDLSEIPHPTVMETLDLLAAMPESLRQRVIFTHMNHSNPLHDPTSEAFKTVSQLGYHVARVGDQFAL
jgi:pyrroloquinoline quinone biosynthesis protein B